MVSEEFSGFFDAIHVIVGKATDTRQSAVHNLDPAKTVLVNSLTSDARCTATNHERVNWVKYAFVIRALLIISPRSTNNYTVRRYITISRVAVSRCYVNPILLANYSYRVHRETIMLSQHRGEMNPESSRLQSPTKTAEATIERERRGFLANDSSRQRFCVQR